MKCLATWTKDEMETSRAAEEERKLIPEGIYSATIIDAATALSQAGNEYVTITLAINDDGPAANRKAFDAIFPNARTERGRWFALKRMREYLQACDLPDTGELDGDKLVGKTVVLIASIDKRDADNIRNRYEVARVSDHPSLSPRPASAPAPAPVKSAPAPAATPDDFLDDDVPF